MPMAARTATTATAPSAGFFTHSDSRVSLTVPPFWANGLRKPSVGGHQGATGFGSGPQNVERHSRERRSVT